MGMTEAAKMMGKKGGTVRAKNLTPERRREIAMMGVKARKRAVDVGLLVRNAAAKLGLTPQQFADYVNSREWAEIERKRK